MPGTHTSILCCRHVSKGEDGPLVPKLFEEINECIVLYMICICFAIHLIERIDVIASCMIFREPMCLLKPCVEIMLAWRHMSIPERIARVYMVYKSISGVGMQHCLRYSQILVKGFFFASTSLLFLFA